jgi:hypothetical protein
VAIRVRGDAKRTWRSAWKCDLAFRVGRRVLRREEWIRGRDIHDGIRERRRITGETIGSPAGDTKRARK